MSSWFKVLDRLLLVLGMLAAMDSLCEVLFYTIHGLDYLKQPSFLALTVVAGVCLGLWVALLLLIDLQDELCSPQQKQKKEGKFVDLALRSLHCILRLSHRIAGSSQ